MQEMSYFSHAWALLTKDKGWLKVIVMLALWALIPIVGWLWILGYEVEWARLVAWGAEGSPKQKNINLSQCLTSGWRVFVVQLGLGVVWMVFYYLIFTGFGIVHFYRFYPYVEVDLSSPVSLIVDVAGVFYGVFLVVASVRAAIYQSCAAGYQLNRIFDMLKRDASGFIKITGIHLLMIFICGVVIAIISFFAMLFVALGAGLLSYGITTGIYNFWVAFFIFLAIVLCFLIVCMIMLVLTLISYAMVGLWLRQFDVLSWGASGDPLPVSPQLGQGSMPVQPGGQGWQQAQPQQPGGQGWQQAQPQQQSLAMNSPVVTIPPSGMGQNSPASATIAPAPASTMPMSSPASPHLETVPFGSPTATSAPTPTMAVNPLPSSNAERVDVIPLSETPLSQGQGRLDELASPVESVSLDGDDLTRRFSQATDAKGLQQPGQVNNEQGSQDIGQEPSH